MWRLVRLRLARSCTTLPTLRQWVEAALLLAAFAAAAVPLGLASGLLSFAPTGDSPGALLAFAAVAVVLPGLFEETIFCALLLPHPAEKLPRLWVAAQVTLSVALFVLWHPLSGWLFVPSARTLFYDGRFLGLCAVFGLVSSLAYLRTGSLWPSVAMHWVIVVGWKLWFGGSILVFGQPQGASNGEALLAFTPLARMVPEWTCGDQAPHSLGPCHGDAAGDRRQAGP